MKFNYIEIPNQWKEEVTKYPHGYTIFEALCSWTTQVDSMVDNVNDWNNYLDNFVSNFRFDTQKEVRETLTEWQNSGLLDNLIQSAIQVNIDEVDYRLSNQLDTKAETSYVNNQLVNKMDKNTGNISITQINKNLGKIDQSYLTTALLAQIAGTAPISPVPDKNSITLDHLAFDPVMGEVGKNLFNKATVTLGSYKQYTDNALIPSETYGYSELIPVEPDTQYIKNNGEQYVILDGSKNYLWGGSGGIAVDVPVGGYFAIINFKIGEENTLQLEKGNTMTEYEPYTIMLNASKIKGLPSQGGYTNFVVVAPMGGDYPNIDEALADTTGDICIIVLQGTYIGTTNIIAANRKVSIIGVDRDNCIIKSTNGGYYYPPLNCSGNISVQNLTFISNNESGAVYDIPSYAVHIDNAGEGTASFKNCKMVSYQNSAIGIGLHQNQTIILDNCELRKESPYDGGALYAHNSQASNVTNQKLIVKNCHITTSHGFAVKIDDANTYNGGVNSPMEMAYYHNICFSDNLHKDSVVWFRDSPINGGVSGQITLKNDSFGNNVPQLNS